MIEGKEFDDAAAPMARMQLLEREEKKRMKRRDQMSMLDECTRTSLILTRREIFKMGLLGGAATAGASVLGPRADVASAHTEHSTDEACGSLTPAAVGGPTPGDRNVLSVRWLGCACFELVYRDQVILLDAWYDRPLCRSIGLTPDQVVRADVICIGHAHFDHIADAASIAKRTGAVVLADQTVGTGVLLSQGLATGQIRAVNGLGGELLHFDGFTIEPILAHHSVGPTSVNSEGETAGKEVTDGYLANLPPIAPADLAASLTVVRRGSFDPLILTKGTIAYLFTLDSGFRFVWLDSGGPITPQLQAVMARVRSTNFAIVGYQVQSFPRFQVPVTMSLVQLFNPDLFVPAHHDELLLSLDGKNLTALPDMATEPLLLAIREAMPKIRTAAPLYRTPVCINTRNGAFSVGGAGILTGTE